jgi:digeranylgeranylglycerophospholipid reductase
MTTGKSCDIIVIGGGPVGCSIASGMAADGCKVIILEQKTFIDKPICCTALISRECLNRFQLPSNLVLKEYSTASIYTPRGNILAARRDSVQAYALNRPGLDIHFYEKAKANGAEFIFGKKAVRITDDVSTVTVEADSGSEGKPDRITARAVVLAVGFGSPLIKGAGIKPGRSWAMGAQAEAEVDDITELEIHTGRLFAPGYFAWLVPVGKHTARVGLMSRRRAGHHFNSFTNHLLRLGQMKMLQKPHFRGITLSPPSRTFGSRLLLAGDCAGQVKPITGGGIYFGLLCADIAVKRLTLGLKRNELSENFLSGYERDWKGLLGREMRLGRLAQSAYGLLGDIELEALLSLAKRYRLIERLAINGEIGFDWHGTAIMRALSILNPWSLRE